MIRLILIAALAAAAMADPEAAAAASMDAEAPVEAEAPEAPVEAAEPAEAAAPAPVEPTEAELEAVHEHPGHKIVATVAADAAAALQALAATEGPSDISKIDLSHVELTPEMLGDLTSAIADGKAPRLQTLRLTNAQLDGAETEALARALRQNAPELRELSLNYNALGDQGAAAVADLTSLENLRHLRLSYNDIGDQGATRLAVAMSGENWPELRTLALGGGSIGEAGGAQLAQALRFSPNLKELQLYANQLGLSAAGIAESLRHTQLKALGLNDNGIPPQGGLALAGALEHLPKLASLGLNANNLDESVAKALARNFQHVPKLTEFYAGDNAFGDEGVSALAEALRHVPSLRSLALYNNGFTDPTALKLADNLRHTENLQNFMIYGNQLEEHDLIKDRVREAVGPMMGVTI